MPATAGRGLISPDDIAKVRDATNLVELAEAVTLVKKVGSNWMARCVFHDDRNPSMNLAPDLGVYYCYSCKAAGDTIRFFEHTQGLGFVAAVEALAERAGIVLTFQESEEAQGVRLHRNALYATVERAASWYHQQLLSSGDAKEARRYLKGRQIDSSAAARFGIGWAPHQRGALARGTGIAHDLGTAAGVFLKDRSEPVEALRGRIVFPIHTPDGRPCALAGRALPGDDGPKYINFSETDVYHKRRVLFGLNLAKQAIVAADEVVVCEGYMDVVGCHLTGVERAVATCGVALTDEHVTVLGRFARRIVMAFDADRAGQEAMEGILRWEKTHRVQFAVARLPEGTDPGQLYEEGRHEVLREAIATAQPLLGWRLDRMFAAADLSTPEGRVTAADRAMDAVCAHPDPRVAKQYIDLVAERCHVDPGPLHRALDTNIARRTKRTVRSKREPTGPKLSPSEVTALRLAVRSPEAVSGWLAPALFSEPSLRRAYEALLQNGSAADAVSATPERVGSILLDETETIADVEDLDELRLRLVSEAARRVLQDFRFTTLEPQAHQWLADRLDVLTEDGDDTACSELLSWLVAHDVPHEPAVPVQAHPEPDDTEPPFDDEVPFTDEFVSVQFDPAS